MAAISFNFPCLQMGALPPKSTEGKPEIIGLNSITANANAVSIAVRREGD